MGLKSFNKINNWITVYDVILTFYIVIITLFLINAFWSYTECYIGRSGGEQNPHCYYGTRCLGGDSYAYIYSLDVLNSPTDSSVLTFSYGDGETNNYKIKFDINGGGTPSDGYGICFVDMGSCLHIFASSISMWPSHSMSWANAMNSVLGSHINPDTKIKINYIYNPSGNNSQIMFVSNFNFKLLDYDSSTSTSWFNNYKDNSSSVKNLSSENLYSHYYEVIRQRQHLTKLHNSGVPNSDIPWTCVDPSYVAPSCNIEGTDKVRTFNQDKNLWCDNEGQHCLSFCAPNQNMSTCMAGYLQKGDGNLYYQSNGPPNYNTMGKKGNLPVNVGSIPFKGTLTDSYSQNLVFCGGPDNPGYGNITDTNDPINSRYPSGPGVSSPFKNNSNQTLAFFGH